MIAFDCRSQRSRATQDMRDAETSFTALVEKCMGEWRAERGSGKRLDELLAEMRFCAIGCGRVVQKGTKCVVCTLNDVEMRRG